MKLIPGLTKRDGVFYYRPPKKLFPHIKGQPKRISLGTSDLNEALDKINELIENGFTERTEQPISELIEPFLIAKRHAGQHTGIPTQNAAQFSVQKFAARFQKPIQQVTKADLELWRGEMFDDDLSAATIQGYLAYVGSFLTWLHSEGKITANPYKKLKALKKLPTKRGRFCTAKLRDQLIQRCENPDLKALLMLGFWMGLRFNEMLNVTPENFELDPKTERPVRLFIQDAARSERAQEFKIKGREGFKVIPVAKPLADFLLNEYQLLDKISDRAAFLILPQKRQGSNRYRWQPKRSWATFMAENECEWVGFHTLRHTFITLALSTPNGPTLQHVAQWTGTSEATLMKHYAHLVDGGNDLIDLID